MHVQYKEYGLTIGLSEESRKYRKYRQHSTSLNKNKQSEISLVFSYIVMKGEIKDKKFWFQSTT